jgi:iron-sulfur cluster repair protein YtfE (RIC family)
MSDLVTGTNVTPDDEVLANTLIRDLVERYPGTMAVLAPLGIDLCCGGAHPLGEALTLHGLDRDAVLPQIASVIQESSMGTARNGHMRAPHEA